MSKDKENFEDQYFPFPEQDFRETFQWRIFRIMAEFVEGFQFVADFDKAVSFFGSSRFDEDNPHYKKAKKLADLLVKKDYSVITGGGPGIMEAANRGAYEADGDSIGINIQLQGEGEKANDYLKKSVGFHYFFTRKVMLSFSSYGYVFFPGGFGTLDELFEMLTLMQTKKLPQPVTVVAVGEDYWNPLIKWFKNTLLDDYKTISQKDLDLIQVVDTPEEALKVIENGKPLKR
ncbi:MAG: TIGR00730 family Rossman fold protein [Patescibacteria group bacterium]